MEMEKKLLATPPGLLCNSSPFWELAGVVQNAARAPVLPHLSLWEVAGILICANLSCQVTTSWGGGAGSASGWPPAKKCQRPKTLLAFGPFFKGPHLLCTCYRMAPGILKNNPDEV